MHKIKTKKNEKINFSFKYNVIDYNVYHRL